MSKTKWKNVKNRNISIKTPGKSCKEDACQIASGYDEWKYGLCCTKVGICERNIVKVLDFKSRKSDEKSKNFEIF